jgi:hypothetical protein
VPHCARWRLPSHAPWAWELSSVGWRLVAAVLHGLPSAAHDGAQSLTTRRALRNGQVDTLILMRDAQIAPETHDALIAWTTKTNATSQLVKLDELLLS